MLFRVNPNDELPIYRQLVRQVKHALATGQLGPGDKLPSHREVSQLLVINHLTVKKAYETLEAQQVIHTLRGLGTYVVDPLPESLVEDTHEQLDQDLAEAIRTAKLLGIDKATFLKTVKRLWDK